MVLHERVPDLQGFDVQILGTDISRNCIDGAQRGVYAEHEMQRTTRPQLTAKYFEPVAGGMRIRDQVRRLCRFEVRNLMAPLQGLGPFDVVLLRNVLIYFTAEAKRDLLARVRTVLLPHGWLFVGATENLLECGEDWVAETHCRGTVYRPRSRDRVVPR